VVKFGLFLSLKTLETLCSKCLETYNFQPPGTRRFVVGVLSVGGIGVQRFVAATDSSVAAYRLETWSISSSLQ